MITISLSTRTLGIEFTHNRGHLIEVVDRSKKLVETNGYTECEVVEIVGNHKRALSIGRASCSLHDQFNKEIGRRIALTRALKEAELEREDRKTVWTVYRGRKERP